MNTAATLGADVISNGYGGSELSSTLSGACDHPGVATTVSSGDAGYGSRALRRSPPSSPLGARP